MRKSSRDIDHDGADLSLFSPTLPPSRLTLTPHPLRSSPPREHINVNVSPLPNSHGDSHFTPSLHEISSPETPHPGNTYTHGRQMSESRHLLPQKSSKSLFQYSSTTAIEFGDVELQTENPFPDWDHEPYTLQRSGRQVWMSALVDLSIVLVVLAFFALAAAMIRVNGKEPRNNQERWFRESSYVAATLLPLIFALVLGRLATRIASFALERGAKLVFLERLMGSRSFFQTIGTQIGLWPFNVLAVCLILVWMLSPSGSQAVLRALTVEERSMSENTNASYFNTRQAADMEGLGEGFIGFSSAFTAAIFASPDVKNGPRDLWGNVRIPTLSSVQNMSLPDDEGWIAVPTTQNAKLTYTSLFGIPISSLSISGNTTLIIESSYLTLSCQNITSNFTRSLNTIDSTPDTPTFTNPNLISPSGPFISSTDITSTTRWAIGYLGHDITPFLPSSSSSNRSFSLDSLNAADMQQEEHYPGLLLFQDLTGLQNVTSIYCTPSQVYIESSLSCSDGVCEVIRQRPSTLPHLPSALTYLSFQPLFLELTRLLDFVNPRPIKEEPNPREGLDILLNYLVNPYDNGFIETARSAGAERKESRLLDIDLTDFGSRLAGVLNAFIQGSMSNSTTYLTGSGIPSPYPTPTPDPEPEPRNGGEAIKANAGIIATQASNIISRTVFEVHWPWMSILLLATLILFLSSLLSPLLHRLTLSPDYLGYVSSLARESSACGLPAGGVNISGLERSRRLGEIEMRLGDVGDVREGWRIGVGARVSVGRLGLGKVQGKGGMEVVRGLGGRKLYV